MPTASACWFCDGMGVRYERECRFCEGHGWRPELTEIEERAWDRVPIDARVRGCLVRAAVPVETVPALPDKVLLDLRNLGPHALAIVRAVLPFDPAAPPPADATVLGGRYFAGITATEQSILAENRSLRRIVTWLLCQLHGVND